MPYSTMLMTLPAKMGGLGFNLVSRYAEHFHFRSIRSCEMQEEYELYGPDAVPHGVTLNALQWCWRKRPECDHHYWNPTAFVLHPVHGEMPVDLEQEFKDCKTLEDCTVGAAVREDVCGMFRIYNGSEDELNLNAAMFRTIPRDAVTRVPNEVMINSIRNRLAVHPLITIDDPNSSNTDVDTVFQPLEYIDTTPVDYAFSYPFVGLACPSCGDKHVCSCSPPHATACRMGHKDVCDDHNDMVDVVVEMARPKVRGLMRKEVKPALVISVLDDGRIECDNGVDNLRPDAVFYMPSGNRSALQCLDVAITSVSIVDKEGEKRKKYSTLHDGHPDQHVFAEESVFPIVFDSLGRVGVSGVAFFRNGVHVKPFQKQLLSIAFHKAQSRVLSAWSYRVMSKMLDGVVGGHGDHN